LKPRRGPFCLGCGRFFEGRTEPHFCASCVHQRYAFALHRSCGEYRGILKDLIILFKYRGYSLLARPLAGFIQRSLGKEEALWWGLDCFIPVPLHPLREKQRGYNQAGLIAEELARLGLGRVEKGLLVKRKNTPPQTSLEAPERRENVKGVYRVTDPEKIRGKVVLLVDDVFTTGATLQECSLVLRRSGALEVRAVTLARA